MSETGEKEHFVRGLGVIRKTRPELNAEHIKPYYADAQRVVERDGWQAIPSYLARQQGRADPRFYESLFIAVVEAAVRALPDPYDQLAMVTSEQIDALRRWLSVLWKNGLALEGSSSPEAYLAHVWTDVVYRVAGGHTYEVAPGLAQRLRHTELRGVQANDLRLPFRSIYIAWPPSESLTIANPSAGWRRVVGVYVTESQILGHRCWHMEFYGEGTAGNPEDFTSRNTLIQFPAGASVDEALSRVSPALQNAEHWLANFRMLMNVVMYATWPDAEKVEVCANTEVVKLREKMVRHPKGSNKYERARQALRGLDARRRIVLGRGIHRWTEEDEGAGGPGKALQVRTLVQGHWRRYHVGIGRAEMVWKFIEPFWRGPQGAEIPAAIHVLK